jgi:hypothetical protein
MEQCGYLLAILQENRVETATKVQEVLTRFGCNIRLRLGLHDSGLASCSNSGLILLQVCGGTNEVAELQSDLSKVPNVKVKSMALDFQ